MFGDGPGRSGVGSLKFEGMTIFKVGVALIATVALGGCGGKGKLRSCDDPERYQESVQNDRLRAPDDLDNLDSLREMPVPEANPTPERPPGSPCLELPPRIFSGGESDE